MADSELEILLRTLADTHGADEVTAALDRVKAQTGYTAEETTKLSEANTDLVSSAGDAGNAIQGASLSMRGMRLVAGQLNKIIPGLGMAFRGLYMSMLPVAAIVLAIQAAVTWWKFYKEQVEETVKAQIEALDKVRAATRAAVEENSRFSKSMADQGTAVEQLNTKLKDQQTILDAQIKAKQSILAADEAAALAQAKTPEEQAAIKSRYAELGDQAESGARAEHLGLITSARDEAQRQQDAAQKEWDDMSWARSNDANIAYTQKEKDALDEKIKAKDVEIEALKKETDRLNHDVSMATSVGKIEETGKFAARNVGFWKAAGNIDEGVHGGGMSKEQAETNRMLTEAFAQQRNGAAAMQSIIKYHLEHSTSQVQFVQALANALKTLQSQTKNLATPSG